MKVYALSLLILITPLVSIAQDLIPRIVPPAPEATSVFKFSEVPVSTYTGLPNISIPIYEIKCKQLTIPITLAYHARGIRVAEMAPRVGLGWSLNYGGMMSRQIRGGADEETLGYLTQDYYNSVFTDENSRVAMVNNYVSNGLDMVPDKFMFSANSTSGNFVFNQVTKDILLQEYKDIIITKIQDPAKGNKITGWVLTDEAGNKFYYGTSKDGLRKAYECDDIVTSYSKVSNAQVQDHGTGGNTQSISTWHLMEIETAFSESVRFYYNTEDKEEVIYYRHSHDYHRSTQVGDQSIRDVVSSFSKVQAYQYQLSKIVYDQGEIVFTSSDTEREDLAGAHTLDKIRIFEKHDTAAVKEFQFLYHYTASPTNNNQLSQLIGLDSKAAKRLFLSSIQEKGKTSLENNIPSVTTGNSQPNDQPPPYSFYYNGTLLPNRFSTSQDVWGYYNGANNGQYLTFFAFEVPADRSVDNHFSQAGLLEKVVYPTGGSTEFTYEHNIAVKPGLMESLAFPALHKVEAQQKMFSMLKNSRYRRSAPGVYVQDSIVIGDSIVGDVLFKIQLSGCLENPSEDPDCIYSVALKRADSATKYNLYPFGPDGIMTRSVNIPPGMYTLEVSQDNPPDVEDEYETTFYVTLEWDEKKTIYVPGITNPETQIPAAGKRLKKIEYKAADSTIFVKEYEYLQTNGQSSGVIFGLPGFYGTRQIENFVANEPYGCLPGSPLSTYQGNSVGYSFVTEYYGTKENNAGKSEYEFTTPQDRGTYYKFPYHLPVDNEWLRGKNTDTRIYKRNAPNSYGIIKDVQNTYLYGGTETDDSPFNTDLTDIIHIDSVPPVFKYYVDRAVYRLPLLTFINEGLGAPFKVYYQTGGRYHLSSTREVFYENNIPQLKTETKYYYDYNSHYQVRSVEQSLSDTTKETTIMTYALDYPSNIPASTFADAMRTRNLVSFPIEKVTYKERNGSYYILSGVLSKYNLTSPERLEEILSIENEKPILLSQFRFSNRLTGILPLSGTPSAFLPDTRYVPKVTFNHYDTRGNILQYSTPDNISVSYVWGYNKSYPIAEIRNATYAQITTVLGQTVIDEFNNSPGTDAQMRLKLQALYTHPSLKNSRVTSYTYNTMFGVTSITDNNGLTTYYSYDGLGRLKEVEDKDHNLVKQVQYNYKTVD